MTTTALKFIALFFMFIDHTAEFIPNMPIYFHWLGRISAPIFVFCTAWGFQYTHNRKTYLLRMYAFSVLMGIMNTILNGIFNKSLIPCRNNIFTTLLVGCIFISLWDIRRKDKKKGTLLLIAFGVFQILSIVAVPLTGIFLPINNMLDLIVALLPNFLFCEGGIIFALLIILLYYNKDTKKAVALSYIIYCLAYFAMALSSGSAYAQSGAGSILDYLLYSNYQWMQIGALPFMLAYNGKKGKGFKYLFYVFYPLHICILFILGNMIAL
ncbi:MAG: TraX family protein [Oscillospiraceae bacterium]